MTPSFIKVFAYIFRRLGMSKKWRRKLRQDHERKNVIAAPASSRVMYVTSAKAKNKIKKKQHDVGKPKDKPSH